MKRVSYSTQEDGNYVSNILPLFSDIVYVLIKKSSLSFQIWKVTNEGDILVSEGNGRDLKECKIKVRKELYKT